MDDGRRGCLRDEELIEGVVDGEKKEWREGEVDGRNRGVVEWM